MIVCGGVDTDQVAPRCCLDLSESGLIRVVCPFDAVTQAQLRRIRPRGQWLGPNRGWMFPWSAAVLLQEQLGQRFVQTEAFQQWLDWAQCPLPPLPAHRLLVRAASLDQTLLDGRLPLRHQRSGARWLLARRGAVLADEMGLGKTLTALLAARAMVRLSEVRVLVIAPVGLHPHWSREASALDLSIELVSWAKLPRSLPPAGTLLIVDEAHYAQTLKAQRTNALLRLARHPRLRAIWMLTGTPMKNGRPSQLFPLLAAIDHPIARDQRLFEERYCQGHWSERSGQKRWKASGASQLQELRALTRPLILHRRKSQLLDLPPKQRRDLPITLSEAECRGFEHRIDLVIEDYRRRARTGEVRSDAECLAVLTAWRRIAAEFKLPALRHLVEDLRRRREPVVIFSAFVDPLQLLHAQIGGALLTGRQKPADRQASVDRFQDGSTDVLLATFGAGGIGFTLHRAKHVVLLERPWTPGDVEQAEDRCHRLGMQGGLTSHWLTLGPADQLVDGLVASKAELIEILLGPRTLSLTRQPLPALLRRALQAA